MARVKKVLRELRDGKAQFISLVDRSASRLPWRVMKRDNKETEDMGLDLSKVVKGDVKPSIAAVSVFVQKNEVVAEAIRQSIAGASLSVETVQKADDETVTYAQTGEGEVVMVRLSDNVLLAVRNMPEVKGVYAAVAKSEGFYPGFDYATGILAEELSKAVKADAPVEAQTAAINEFADYSEVLMSLPESVFKMDGQISTLVAVEEKAQFEAAQKAEEEAAIKEETKEEVVVDKGGDKCPECGETYKMEEKDGKQVKVCKCSSTMKADEPVPEPAPVVEEKPNEQLELVLKALSSLQETVTTMQSSVDAKLGEMAQKVDGVVQTQNQHASALDEAVKKAETVHQRLNGTVHGAPPAGDVPAGKETAVKQDFEPITDTAMQRHRRR